MAVLARFRRSPGPVRRLFLLGIAVFEPKAKLLASCTDRLPVDVTRSIDKGFDGSHYPVLDFRIVPRLGRQQPDVTRSPPVVYCEFNGQFTVTHSAIGTGVFIRAERGTDKCPGFRARQDAWVFLRRAA